MGAEHKTIQQDDMFQTLVLEYHLLYFSVYSYPPPQLKWVYKAGKNTKICRTVGRIPGQGWLGSCELDNDVANDLDS